LINKDGYFVTGFSAQDKRYSFQDNRWRHKNSGLWKCPEQASNWSWSLWFSQIV